MAIRGERDEDGFKRGRGRPKKEENTYDYVFKLRLNEDQMYLLRDLEVELDLSRAEIIRQALETFHNIKIKWR